jgi:hypothetical protein
MFKTTKPILGRWKVKNCAELSASINSIYQNRDHCGDTICKNPVQAADFIDKIEIKKKTGK